MYKPKMNKLLIAILLTGCLTRNTIAMSVELLNQDSVTTTTLESLDGDPRSTRTPEPFEYDSQPTWTQETFDDDPPPTPPPNCTFRQLQPEDVIRKKGKVILKAHNLTFLNSQPFAVQPSLNLCFTRSENLNREIFAACPKWEYTEEEFRVYPNGTVMLFDFVMEPGSFEIKKDKLRMCADEDPGDDGNSTGHVSKNQMSNQDLWSVIIGQVGSSISIVALTAHLVSFCLVPTMRNLPGYNLASLSAALLLAYLFQLIGQIPEVLGFFCVLCGVLVQIFFLSAFFFMNTLAFDVWRTLKMATTQLCVSSHGAKRRQFICYSIYSWGTSLLITATSVVVDNTDAAPAWIRPEFGKGDVCWMTNGRAKTFFFTAPAFALFVANAIFFVMSAVVIRTNTMKCSSEEQRQTARNNFVLYLRLGMMMGVTWLFGVVAAISNESVVWMVFDFMNSLQGLFVFLLFTCSKKVFDRVREKLHLEAVLKTPKTSTSDLTGRTIVSHKS